MEVVIYYCVIWDYEPEASRLEEELKRGFLNVDIQKIKSSGGDFKVIVDGQVLFDKLAIAKRFPNEGEITQMIKAF